MKFNYLIAMMFWNGWHLIMVDSTRPRRWVHLLLAAGFALLGDSEAHAKVTVTEASGGGSISVATAATGGTGAWTSLGTITIVEGANADFAKANSVTLILKAPVGFQFNTNAAAKPNITFTASRDLKSASVVMTNPAMITLTLTIGDKKKLDTLILGSTTRIQVRPIAGTPLATGKHIYRPAAGGGTAVIAGITTSTDGSSGSNFGTLTEVAGAVTKLVFTTSPITVAVGVASGTITVQRQDAFGNPNTAEASRTVILTSSSGGVATFNPASPVTIASGASSVNITYKDTQSGMPVIKATSLSPSTITSAMQQEMVTPPPTITWDGGGTNDAWNTGANWLNDIAPSPGATLHFAGTKRLTPSNNFTAGVSMASLYFDPNAGAFTLNGNQITLNTCIENNSANLQRLTLPLILQAGSNLDIRTLGTGGDMTLSGTISGSGLLQKSGTNTLTLSGGNTFTNSMTISAGTLAIAGAGKLDNGAYAAAISNNGLFNYASTATQTLSGIISGGGALAITNGGTLILAGNNTFSGGIRNYAGTLVIGNGGLSGTLGVGDVRVMEFPRGNFQTVAFNRADPVESPFLVTNAITAMESGHASFLKVYTGAVQLGGTNDNAHTVGIVSNGATLILAKTPSSSSVTAPVHALGQMSFVQPGGTLRLAGTGGDQIADIRSLSVASGGVFDLNGRNETITALTNAGTGMGGVGSVINSSPATTSTLTTTSGIVLTNHSSMGGAGDLVLAGAISGGNVALTKVGIGTLTLNRANTYSGPTTISGGTLALRGSGSIANSSIIDVASGATFDVSVVDSPYAVGSAQALQGAGTVEGSVSVVGRLDPGTESTRAALTVRGDVSFTPGATFRIDVQAADSDSLLVSGNVALGGATLAINGSLTADTYVILQVDGVLSGTFNGLAEGAPIPSTGYSIQYVTGHSPETVVLTKTISPIKYVIHISVDGMHADAARTLVNKGVGPNFARLFAEGAYTEEARTDYDSTVTSPNHATIITGRPVNNWPGKPGHLWGNNDTHPWERWGLTLHVPHVVGTSYGPGPGGLVFGFTNAQNYGYGPNKTNDEYVSSVLDVVHDNGKRTCMVYGKDRIRVEEQSYLNKVDYGFYAGDFGVVSNWLPQMIANPFHYSFLHFALPDDIGHSYSWSLTNAWHANITNWVDSWNADICKYRPASYMGAITKVDGWLGEIFSLIETNAELKGRTAIVLTSDHGGWLGQFDHGWVNQPDCFRVDVFAWGPGIPAGADLYAMNPQYTHPGRGGRPDYNAPQQPIRDGDTANLALSLIGLGSIPGSSLNVAQSLGAIDSDVDGLSDNFEWTIFTNPTLKDTDGDGVADGDEVFAGTNPTRSDSMLQITGLEMVPAVDSAVVKWSSVANRKYTVWGSSNLFSEFAIIASDIPATPPINAYTNQEEGAQQMIYRISVQP